MTSLLKLDKIHADSSSGVSMRGISPNGAEMYHARLAEHFAKLTTASYEKNIH